MDVRRRRSGVLGIVGAILIATIALQIGSSPTAQAAAPTIRPLGPTRLLDTRPGNPTFDGQFSGIGRRDAGSITELQVAGRGDIPASADAIFVNVTAVLPNAPTAITVFPCGIDRPNASNVNLLPGDIRANGVFVKLSVDGTVCIYTVAAVDIVVDLNGFVPSSGTPSSVNPARLLDTRPGNRTVDGQSAGIGRRGPGSVTEIAVAGRGGVPFDATAALLNLTADMPAAGTALTVFPCDIARPNASNLNVPAFDTRANNVFVKLSNRGTVCIHTVAAVDIIADVNGYVPAGASPARTNPARLLDTRPGNPTIDGISAGTGRVRGGTTTIVKVAGRAGVPADATAAFVNVTSVFPTLGTFLSVFPCDVGPTSTSSVNSPPGDIRANNVFVRLSASGTMCIYNVSSTDIVVDVNGYVPAPKLQSCTINGTPVPTQLPPSECAALTALYSATGGANWYNRSGWLTSTDPCTWFGVTCQDGHVSGINLEYSNLSGAVPDQIGNFSQLTDLNLGGNRLTSISKRVGQLNELTTLNLSRNLIADLPAEVGQLPVLDYLDVSSNLITTMPPAIGGLNRLRTLYLHYNQLTSLPSQLGDLSQLKVLLVNNNGLTSLPVELNRLTTLTTLSARDNQLAGDITAIFSPLKNGKVLTSLTLRGNDCLTTTDSALAAWLQIRDPKWDDGC